MIKLVCEQCGQEYLSRRRKRRYCSILCRNEANSALRSTRYNANLASEDLKIVWSCGGGVQSAGIAAMIVEGYLPKPDHALMVDTGYEKTSTMDYVHHEIVPRLQAVGVQLHIIQADEHVSTDLVTDSGMVAIPAYMARADGSECKLETRCNGPWKTKLQHRWLRDMGLKRVEQWIGISLDEQHRRRHNATKWLTLRYPLVERQITRHDCCTFLEAHGWPVPHHSACLMCPNQSDEQWLLMRECYPQDWARAVALEAELQARAPGVYLHRQMVPLADVHF